MDKRVRVTVRLYRRHDLDLIALYRTEGFKFQKEMAACARAAASGKTHEVTLPKGEPGKGYVKRNYMISLGFDRVRDADVLRMLENIKPGMRCPYLKALMRTCISGARLSIYNEGNGIYISEDAARNGRQGREPELPVRQVTENPSLEQKRPAPGIGITETQAPEALKPETVEGGRDMSPVESARQGEVPTIENLLAEFSALN